MSESVITEYLDYCLICNARRDDLHHGICGTANRKKSDKYRLIIPLCKKHHMGTMSVHHNHEMNVMSHIISQLAFEKYEVASGLTESEARKKFLRVFGKSYL